MEEKIAIHYKVVMPRRVHTFLLEWNVQRTRKTVMCHISSPFSPRFYFFYFISHFSWINYTAYNNEMCIHNMSFCCSAFALFIIKKRFQLFILIFSFFLFFFLQNHRKKKQNKIKSWWTWPGDAICWWYEWRNEAWTHSTMAVYINCIKVSTRG